MKKAAKNILMFLVIFSPVLFIVAPLFFAKGFLFFTDFVFGPHIVLNGSSPSLLLNIAIKGSSFVLSFDLIQKIFITLCLGLILWGGRKIAGFFLKEPWLVFVASLFSLFNPFVYDRAMYGQFGVVGAFGLMLIGIGFLLEYIDKKRTRQILFAGIAFAFAVQFSPQFVFFIAAFYIFVFLPMLFIFSRRAREGGALRLENSQQGGWKHGSSAFADDDKKEKVFDRLRAITIEVIKISVILALIAFALNANWIIGSVTGRSAMGEFVSNGITTQDLTAFQTSGTTGGDAFANVLMMSGFWGKDQFRYTDLTKFADNWGKSFFLLLPLIAWGFIAGLRSKEKKYRYLMVGSGLLFVVSVVLAVGIRLPVAREITDFLFNHFPFYKGLREPQKWVSITTAVYLIFLSMGLRELFSKKIIQRHALVMKCFVGAVIVMEAPLLLFGFGGQVTPTQYPNDWYAVNDYIVHDSGCAGNTLFFPWHQYMSFSWLGRIVANPAPAFFQCPIVSGTDMEWGGIYDNSQNLEGQAVDDWLAHGGATDLLRNGAFNIRYVILAKEIDWENYAGMGANPELQLVMETATLRVYKVIK